MIYIATIILCLLPVWKYDWNGETKNKDRWFYGLLFWFIVVSGLQYGVGSDTLIYMTEFQESPKQLGLINEYAGEKRQPGWLLLMWFCRQFTDNFLLPKIIQAIFFNVAVFSFFKRESKYVFLCIFFYAFSDYLVINFNVLRQSFAIAFGLYAISYLKNGKYFKYGLFVFLAFMFHNTAVFLLTMPFVKFFKANKLTMGIGLGVFVIAFLILRKVSIETIALGLLGNGFVSESGVDMMTTYLYSERLGMRETEKVSIQVLIALLVTVYCIIKRHDVFWGGFGIAYVLLLLLTIKMPILFRFRLYFDFQYYIMLSGFIVETPLRRFRQVRHAFYIGAIMIFMFFPTRNYFQENPMSNLRYIDQYYPYHSVFDPKLEERY